MCHAISQAYDMFHRAGGARAARTCARTSRSRVRGSGAWDGGANAAAAVVRFAAIRPNEASPQFRWKGPLRGAFPELDRLKRCRNSCKFNTGSMAMIHRVLSVAPCSSSGVHMASWAVAVVARPPSAPGMAKKVSPSEVLVLPVQMLAAVAEKVHTHTHTHHAHKH